MSNEIVTKEPAGVLANFEERLAKEAQDAAAKERVFAPKIQNVGGKITIGGQSVAENKLQAVILGTVIVRALYETDYKPDDFSPPSCWAIAENEDLLVPSSEGWKQVNPTCKGCPANEWSSSGTSKAKACTEKRRMIVMAANDLKSPEAIKEAEIWNMEQPPTGLKSWALFVKGLRDNLQRPPHGVITEITTQPVKTWHIWSFRPLDLVPLDLMGAVYQKIELAKEQLLMGWEKPSEDPAARRREQEAKAKKF